MPVVSGPAGARIVRGAFGELVGRYGAQFAYVLDVKGLEGRHWNNDGVLEDVATGSAGAYLARHRVVPVGEEFVLRQWRLTGRPSLLAGGRAVGRSDPRRPQSAGSTSTPLSTSCSITGSCGFSSVMSPLISSQGRTRNREAVPIFSEDART